MRENRLSGSEGGGTEANQSFLPLSALARRRLRQTQIQLEDSGDVFFFGRFKVT